MGVIATELRGTSRPKYKVLLVDDEREIVRQIRMRFEFEGFDVLEAHDGREARRICDRDGPDVVITDVRMPVVSGTDFLKDLYKGNAANFNLPIVICISGYSDLSLDQALESGASAFFAKPIDPGDLVATSRSFLRKKEMYELKNQEALEYKRQAEEGQVAVDQIGMQFMHELKNHVAGMVSALERLLVNRNASKTMSDPSVRKLVETANRKGWELNEIIKTVYGVFSAEGMALEVIDANNLLRASHEFVKDFLVEKNVELTIDPGMNNFLVLCPPGSVRQIIFNLLKNAAEALSEKSSKSISLSVSRDGNFGYFTVQDAGSGIPEEMWNTVLGARFTTKGSNLGIGLSFCAKAAEDFGGFIRIEKSDLGARISLGIPLADPKLGC
jgi:DNA-binding response OmpR family regulator